MSIQTVREHLGRFGRDADILELAESTATVAQAAQALGTQPERIAKTLSLQNNGGAMLVVTAGDARLDNARFRKRFGFKPRMLSGEDALQLTGHEPGGICPFGLPDGVLVYLDQSLRRFDTVYPACGSTNSAIEMTGEELEEYTDAQGWVDVCKDWEEKDREVNAVGR